MAILAADDSQVGAIGLYGPACQLPRVISGSNSIWFRGYGDPPPEIVIAVGNDPKILLDHFESCTLAGHLDNRWGIRNNVFADYSGVFVCRHCGIRGLSFGNTSAITVELNIGCLVWNSHLLRSGTMQETVFRVS